MTSLYREEILTQDSAGSKAGGSLERAAFEGLRSPTAAEATSLTDWFEEHALLAAIIEAKVVPLITDGFDKERPRCNWKLHSLGSSTLSLHLD